MKALPIFLVLTGCPSEAQQDVKEATKAIERTGEELGQAAKKTAEHVDERAEVAGEQLGAQLDRAREKLAKAKQAADHAGDLYMDRDEPTSQVRCEAEHYAVDRAMVENAIANPMKIAGTTSFEPVAGKGYRITGVDPESPVGKLDVRVGDILVEVDGTSVTSLDGAKLVSRLRETEEVKFTVERNGEDVEKTVKIDS